MSSTPDEEKAHDAECTCSRQHDRRRCGNAPTDTLILSSCHQRDQSISDPSSYHKVARSPGPIFSESKCSRVSNTSRHGDRMRCGVPALRDSIVARELAQDSYGVRLSSRVGGHGLTSHNTHFPRRGLRPLATAGEVIGLRERRWTPLRRPDGRLSGRRKTQNVSCHQNSLNGGEVSPLRRTR
jgi:hypothetical protein